MTIHFVDGNIGVAVRNDRICVAELAADAIHVEELLHRAPALVPLAPVGAWREPDGEGFGEVFVGMLLRVPAFHVAHELAREGNRFVVVAIGPTEGSEAVAPFFSFVERVGVVEGVSSLVAHVHHDLARVFNVVHRGLEALQFWVGEVERDSDDRLHVGAAPLVGEVALGPESLETLRFQLLVELLDEAFERGAFQLQAELLDGLGEDLLYLYRRFFEIGHRWSKRSTGRAGSG